MPTSICRSVIVPRWFRGLAHVVCDAVEAPAEQARILAVVSLLVITLCIAALVLDLISPPHETFTRGVITGEIVVAVLLYSLSRTRYYQLGAQISLMATYSVGLLFILAYQTSLSLLMLGVPILLATLLFRGRIVLLITGITVITSVVIGYEQPGTTEGKALLVFFMLFTGLVLSFQNAIKAYSQREQAAAVHRYQSLFEQSNDAVFILDLNGRHLEVNQRAVELLGYSRAELLELSQKDIVVAEEHGASSTSLKSMLLGIKLVPYERTFLRKDGTKVPVEINVELVRDQQGQPLHLQSLVRDISSRTHLEAELRQSEARQRAMLEAIPDIVFRCDASGNFIDYHATNTAQLLASPHIRMGNTLSDLVPEAVAQEHLALIQAALTSNQRVVHEFELFLSETSHHWESRIIPAGIDEVFVFVRDLTELWQVRHDLELLNARLEFSAEATRIAWWEADIATGKVQFDARKVAMLGYNPDDFKDVTYHAFTNLIHPEDQATVEQGMFDLILGKKPIYRAEYRMHRADGDWIWVHDQGELVHAEDGSLVVRAFVIDITERKLAQQREVELALEKERVNLLSQFIRDASHEFRTPLSVISSSTYLMTRLADPTQRASKAEQINAEIDRITRLLDGLLLTVRLDSTTALPLRPVNVLGVIEIVGQHAKAKYGADPQLELLLQPSLADAMAEETYLETAVQELVDNAYHFTPSTGTVTIAAGVIENQIWLEVRDTGVGIATADLSHIFETFWRGDQAHSSPGFGLGLAIVQRIVDKCGGTIMVHSEIGQGTCFRMVLSRA